MIIIPGPQVIKRKAALIAAQKTCDKVRWGYLQGQRPSLGVDAEPPRRLSPAVVKMRQPQGQSHPAAPAGPEPRRLGHPTPPAAGPLASRRGAASALPTPAPSNDDKHQGYSGMNRANQNTSEERQEALAEEIRNIFQAIQLETKALFSHSVACFSFLFLGKKKLCKCTLPLSYLFYLSHC